MSEPATMFDEVVNHYVRDFCGDKPEYTDSQIKLLSEAIQQDVLKSALSKIEENLLDDAKKRVEDEAKAYKRKLLRPVRVSLIVETIFLAFFVGIIINQVTELLPTSYWGITIIASLVICVLLVMLATAEPGE